MRIRIQLLILMRIRMRIRILIFIWCGCGFGCATKKWVFIKQPPFKIVNTVQRRLVLYRSLVPTSVSNQRHPLREMWPGTTVCPAELLYKLTCAVNLYSMVPSSVSNQRHPLRDRWLGTTACSAEILNKDDLCCIPLWFQPTSAVCLFRDTH